MTVEIPNAALLSKEVLTAEFENLLASVEEEIAENSTPSDIVGLAMGEEDDEVNLARRDRLAELLEVLTSQADRIRKFVRVAEERARHEEAKVNRIKWSLQVWMLCRGVKEIPGLIHRFAIHKQPDRVMISAESQIPEEYWETRMIKEKFLNKEKLEADLNAGKIIAGAFIEKNRKRLAIK